MEKSNNSRKVERAIAIVKREDGRIAMVERYVGEMDYLSLPTGYLMDSKFAMAKEASMKDDQELKLNDAEKLIKCDTVLRNKELPCMVICTVDEGADGADDSEEPVSIGEYEYRLVWLDEEEVFERLKNAIDFGEKFYKGLDMSESSLYALLVYCMKKS